MLKKIVLTLAAVTALAGISFAMSNPDFIENAPGINFKVSTNVKVAYLNDGTNVAQKYAIISKHTAGDTYYATSNLSTAIMKQQDSSYMGKPLTLADKAVTGVVAGDTTFVGGKDKADYAAM